MKKVVLTLSCVMFFGLSTILSQTRTITGAVTDIADGIPIPGASVHIKGTTVGTITQSNGTYSLSVPQDAEILVFAFVGMKTQEIEIGGRTTINVILESVSQALSEVVVVGYGTMKKSDLSGSSVTVGEDKIKGSIITNLDQALQGRAAGITSVMTSGAPGSAVSIRIRGQATINSAAEPLYVVDGVIWQVGTTNGRSSPNGLDLGLALGNGRGSMSPLSTLNPSDIVSMEILKDASATAIYGAQGSNGVVLITTKRGKAGEARFSYDGLFGVQNQTVRLEMMNLREYAKFNNSIAQTTGGQVASVEFSDPSLLGEGTSWQDAIFRQALMHQHTIAAQGGTENTKYYVSGSYMNQDGTMIGTDFSRFSVRTNLDADLKPWLKLGFNAMYSQSAEHLTRAEGDEGVLTYSLLTPPDIPIYDAYGNYSSTVKENYTRINPIAISELNKNLLERQKLNGNIFLEVKPIKDLIWHTELGYDIGLTETENWQPTYYFGEAVQNPINSISQQMSKNYYWQAKNFLTYSGKIDKHSFSAMIGQEAWESKWKWQRISSRGLPGDEVKNPDSADESTKTFSNGFGDAAMSSFFTRETYNYDDRYLLTYTFRYDGSSNFGPNNRWAPFHSVAGSWRFTNEVFFESVKYIINEGKIRIGWGQTGNQSIGGGRWNSTINSFPTGLGTAYRQGSFANPYIQWESQEQLNLGVDLSFLNSRINLVVDLYDKTSKNMLMQLQTPTYFGARGNGSSALGAPYGNYGTINNKGLEIGLNTRNIETVDFSWSSDFQISFNKNKLVALQGTDASGLEGYGQWGDVVSLSVIGGSLYEFYGYIVDGVYRDKADIESHLWAVDDKKNLIAAPGGFDRYSTVFVGDTKYRDLNNDGIIDSKDRTSLGSPLPKFVYGFNNAFTYKNFDFTLFIQGSYGNKIFNNLKRDLTNMGWNTNQLKLAMDYANIIPINESVQYPRVDDYGRTINYWFEDIDNVMLSNPETMVSRAGRGLPYNNSRTSSRYIEDGSYLRIKNIMLGYSLPKDLLRQVQIENVRVYANIQNLFTFTKYTGYDPEVGINQQDASGYTFGFDQGRYPSPRLISFGINVTF